jgi:hypothetical protein
MENIILLFLLFGVLFIFALAFDKNQKAGPTQNAAQFTILSKRSKVF